MEKIKKIVMIVVLAILIAPALVSAKTKETYFKTESGYGITEEQYNNLIKVFSRDTIYTMDKSVVDLYKDNKNLTKSEKEIYVRTDEYFDENGNVISSVDKEVSKEVAESFVQNQKGGIQTLASSHQTNMKKITIGLVAQLSVKTITITNTWLSIPSVKSYDVIGYRNGTGAAVSINSVSGYQKWDGNVISYNSGSENYKSAGNGCGISMNIVDNVSRSLENSMTVTVINNAYTYTAYGTYQHAQSNVTLAQSKNYTVNANGLGGVLDFAASVRGYYDGMQGVNITKSVG